MDNGIYYDSYTDVDGETRYAIATFLEPTAARKVFVGFDDPWFKANYSLSLIHPKNAQVFANAPQLKSNVYDNERNLTIFETTGPMSTYLFAFAMGSFHVAETKTKSNIKIRAMAFANVTAPLDMWADAARKCVESMELLVNVSYPFKKLDNLEMYTMMFAEAMENTQLIIYQNVLNRALHSSGAIELTSSKSVICHEVAHQWFGDLTTAEVWGYEALHESFANFFENRALQEQMEDVDKQEIEMKCVSDRESGLLSSEKLDHAVFDNRSHFDQITYQSGGAILRMIQLAIGSENFYKALNIYLKRNYLGNANEVLLTDAFEKALENQTLCGSLTIREVMNDFLLQPHFPEIFVDVTNESYVIQQKSIAPNDTTKWNVPLFTFNLNTKEEMLVWLLKDGSICSKSPLNYPAVYLFNTHAASFARVRYSKFLWKKFWSMSTDIDSVTLYGMLLDLQKQPHINWKKVTDKVLNRFINGTTENFSSMLIDLYTKNDKDYVWEVLVSKIDWSATSLYGRTFNFVVSWDAYILENARIQSEAKQFYDDLSVACQDLENLEKCNTIPFEARPIAYCYGFSHQNDKFMEKYAERIEHLANTYLYLKPETSNFVNARRCAKTQEK
ncbi:Thyrotropin-releasing hormone-degrading ectoenzyme [Aphelenchoides besseyi]|nr:Thyrotropin-releasing hormone-degrading ectoenzyme [Aphelenchoides besseyi]